MFHPSSGATEDLEAVEAVALKTLRALPHTPVTGYGVNFHFYDSLCGNFDHGVFNADDYVKLADRGFRTLERKILRKIEIDVKTVLNLTLLSMESGGLDIDLNFHRQFHQTIALLNGRRTWTER